MHICLDKHFPLRSASNTFIARGFHRTFATDAAFQQRTLTPPDTWSCPTLGLASVLILRPISPELVLFPDFWVSNIPRYFCFALNLQHFQFQCQMQFCLHVHSGTSGFRKVKYVSANKRPWRQSLLLSRLRQNCWNLIGEISVTWLGENNRIGRRNPYRAFNRVRGWRWAIQDSGRWTRCYGSFLRIFVLYRLLGS